MRLKHEITLVRLSVHRYADKLGMIYVASQGLRDRDQVLVAISDEYRVSIKFSIALLYENQIWLRNLR